MSNPLKLISEMQIPKPNSIIVCGILVLEEKRAAAKIITKNIGIAYSKVSVPPWFKTMTLLLTGATTANIRLFVFKQQF
jgi:hypothetical protein